MGPACGCKRKGDDFETSLARGKIENDRLFEKNFGEKVTSIGEALITSLEDIIPESIKELRNNTPFSSFRQTDSDSIHYKDEVKLKNGIIYKGGWNDSLQMEGKGLMLLVNDQVLLEGIWKEGNFVFGRIYFKEGSYYEGEVSGTLLNGQGKFVNVSKEKYEGSFVNGLREGQGCYHFDDGCVYIGEFTQDNINGNGIMKWSNGTSYTGNFNNGVLEGNGELILANGCKYTGAFKNNWPEGEGEYSWPNSVMYIGNYERGKKEGKGQYQLNKMNITGTWSNGMLQGKATILYNDKSYYTIWRNGKLLETKEPGQEKEINYFNSIPIQNEEYDPSQLSHIVILNESRFHYYKPLQTPGIGTKSFESYFNTSMDHEG